MFKGLQRLLRFLAGGKVKKGYRRTGFDREMAKNKWQEIEIMMQTGGASRLRSAIIEADKLLDYTLREKGFKGETMGERLKSAQGRISRASYEAAWHGHKLRNRLVHEIDADVLYFEVKKDIDNFAQVLRELGAI